MASEDVELPAIGKTKKQWVYVGMAGGLGFVVYAWWKNRSAKSAAAQQPVLAANDVVPATDYVNPSPGGSSPVSVDSTGGAITTNAQWTQAATNYLATIGWDPKLISSALGKYLARTGLTPDEITAVMTAVGAEGPPPVGGPYAVIPATTTATGGADHVFNPAGQDLGEWRYGSDQISYLTANIGKYGITQAEVNDVKAAYDAMVSRVGATKAADYHFSWIGPGNVEAIPKYPLTGGTIVRNLP